MIVKTRAWFSMVVIPAAMVLLTGSALASFAGHEGYLNNTGQTAYGLARIIERPYWIDDVAVGPGWTFQQYEVMNFGDYTIIRFYDGEVAPGDFAWMCFSVAYPEFVEAMAAVWMDENGTAIGNAGPPVAISVSVPVGPATGVGVSAHHFWREWIGDTFPPEEGDGPGEPMGLITGTQVNYAVTSVWRSTEDLDSTLFTDPPPDIVWKPLPDFQLAYGEMLGFDIGHVGSNQIVVVRFDASGEGQSSTRMVQARGYSVPTFTPLGMVVLVVLLVASGAWVVTKRRRMARVRT